MPAHVDDTRSGGMRTVAIPDKAQDSDLLGRFREVISDPLNLLIERVPMAGVVAGNEVYLHNGNRVPIAGPDAYYGVFSQLLVVNRGVHEPLEEYVFQELLKRMPQAPLMIELGAYWAHYSMWLKKVRPAAKSIMIEPDPAGIAAGKNNFHRNGFTGEFVQAAVAKGQIEIDLFLQQRQISHVGILHVDIQGFEDEMLQGCRASLASAVIDYLFISTHSQQLHQSVRDRLTQSNYRIEVSSDFDNETTSSDGFIFSSSPNVKPVFRDFAAVGRKAIAESHPNDLLQAILNVQKSTA